MTVKVMPPGVITNAPKIFTTADGWHLDATFIKKFTLKKVFGLYVIKAITRDNSAWQMAHFMSRDEADTYLSLLNNRLKEELT